MTAEPDTQHREPARIHLLWEGPHTLADILEMHGVADYGIYQVYGPHPVNGTDSLLLHRAGNDQTFGARFTNPDRQQWGPNDEPWETTLLCCGSSWDGFTRLNANGEPSMTNFGEPTSTGPRSS